MASEYFTTTPEIKAPVEVAAAAGNYTSFQVPLQGSVVPPVSMTAQVEDSATENQHEGESEVENASEVQVQTEQSSPDAELDQNSRDVDSRDPHASRRSYQNRRGSRGDRRDYSNGRGGRGSNRGGHENGRSQFYDQPGGYYPRNNYHYRGRSGSCMAGKPFNHHAPGGHVQAAS